MQPPIATPMKQSKKAHHFLMALPPNLPKTFLRFCSDYEIPRGRLTGEMTKKGDGKRDGS
jgi:hypothetical protein